MSSIIEEIQREALRPDARVGGLLRMVKLAAAKLKLTDVGDWVEHELKGYPLGSTVPDYRVVRGELKAFNPFNGWIPITGPGVADLSQRYIAQPITAIEDILSQMQVGESHRLTVPLPPKVVEALDRSGEIAFGRYALMIDRGAAVQMVEAVRNLVLDWAIQMEASGVTGSDFSFTPEERDAAKAAPSPIQIGSIHSFAGNLGGAGNIQGSNNVQVGNGNSISGNIDINKVMSAIEAAPATEPEKEEARNLFTRLCGNPTFASIAGAIAGMVTGSGSAH